MSWIAELAAWSMLSVGVLLFAAQIAAREIGYWFGRVTIPPLPQRP